MSEDLPWFRALPAQERSWIGLIAGAGISSFVDWLKEPGTNPTVVANVFGTAPRELAGIVSLQQTVEMVRTTIAVIEDSVESLAGPRDAHHLRDSLMVYAREVAFAAAEIYARAAEQ